MKIFDMKTSFAGGELSPLLHARVDLAQYATGVARLNNFLILPQGGIANRPGTRRLNPQGQEYEYASVRLVPFVFSQEDSLVLAFADQKLDIYLETGLLVSIPSPYRSRDLPGLRWLQSADVLYLFHPDVQTRILKRNALRDWEFETLNFKNGPFRDMNTAEDAKVKVIRQLSFDNAFIVTCTKEVFKPRDLVGALLLVEHRIRTDTQQGWLKGPDTSEAVYIVKNVFGAFTYRTSGKWTGSLEVFRADKDDWSGLDEEAPQDWPDGIWKPFKVYFSDTNAEENFSFSGVVEEYSSFFKFVRVTGSSRVVINFDFEGGLVNRVFKITDLFANSNYSAVVESQDGIFANIVHATSVWAFGAINDHFGYPSLGVFHQERLVLTNTRSDPQTIWMSQPASWHDFGTSIPTKDDDAITVTLASKQVNEITGLASRGDLLIFTSGAEFTAKAGAKTDVFTPSSIVVTPSGYRGSFDIPTLDVGSSVLFVQRNGQTVRALGYSLEIDNYAASDLTIMSEHLFQNTLIRAWAYQQSPWGIVWTVLSNGELLALTLNQDHKITGWGRHDLSGDVLDVCAIPSSGQDEVFFAVSRDSGITIERLLRRSDSYCTQLGFLDGGRYPVKSEVELLEWEQQVGGTLQGRHKNISAATIRVLNTCGLSAGVVTENNTRLDEFTYDPPYTGDIRTVLPGGMGRMCRLRIENDVARPVTILGVFPEVDIYGEGQG